MSDVERRPWPRDPRYLVGDDGTIVGPKGHELAGVMRSGYRALSFRVNGRSCMESIHVIVCETFHGPKPVILGVRIEVAHENGSPLDCRATNLRWSTAQGNNDDRVKHGTMPYGERNGFAKLTENDVREMRTSNASVGELAERYGVTKMNVIYVLARKTWRHVA